MHEHPIERLLFNNTGYVTLVWLAVRLILGYEWLTAGWSKLQSAEWMNGSKIAGFWNGALADYQKPNSDVAFDWYAGFLRGLVNNHAQTWFAPLIAWAELLGGIALILGLFTGITALLLAFLNFNYMLAGSAGVNPIYFLAAILLVLAWKNAGWWGLDRFLLNVHHPAGTRGSLAKPRLVHIPPRTRNP